MLACFTACKWLAVSSMHITFARPAACCRPLPDFTRCLAASGSWHPLAISEPIPPPQTPQGLTPRPSVDGSTTPGRATPRATTDMSSGRQTPRASAGAASRSPRVTADTAAVPGPSVVIAQATQHAHDLDPTADYMWCGQTKSSVPALSGNQCASSQLHVAVFQAGSYTISDYSVVYMYPNLGGVTGMLACPTVMFQVSDAGEC